MLYPTKYERLNNNLLVIGADAISLLKTGSYDVESLFKELNIKSSRVSLSRYFDLMTFLWGAGLIEIKRYTIALNKDVPA